MAVEFDFSDVDAFIQQGKQEVMQKEAEIGQEAVEYNVREGSYQNRTGNLRRSNSFEVDESGLTIKNTAEYASFVESKGYLVAGAGAIYAESRLKEEFE
jgi:hypothetical protein